MAKRSKTAAAVATPDRALPEIIAIVRANSADPMRGTYEGLRSSEIARYSGYLMFGENDQAFPSQEEWSRIVD
jgi:hypothetical protein